LKLENRTLTIAVADRDLAKAVDSMRGQLLFRSKLDPGQPLVGAFDFVIDAKLAKHARSKRDEEPLDNEVPLELWSAANAIHDQRLRKSF
jgi:hypothetical protein